MPYMKRYDGFQNPIGDTKVEVVRVEGGHERPLGKLSMFLEDGKQVPSGFDWGYGGNGPHALAQSLASDVLADCSLLRLVESPDFNELWTPVLSKVAKFPSTDDEESDRYGEEWHHEWSVEQHEVLSWMMPVLMRYVLNMDLVHPDDR